MLGFSIGCGSRPLKRVLVLGAHSDDIEIGAGGTIRWLLEQRPDIEVHWVVFAASGQREREARESASEILGQCAGRTIETHAFRDGFFPYEGARLKEAFERLKAAGSPDIVFTHHRDDLHQDHRLVGELTWNTFRDHVIFEYEVPKYDGGLGSPNLFVQLDAETVATKVDRLMRHFGTQRSKGWFTPETFRSLLRLRGIECQSPTGYAEAFYVRKAVWAAAAACMGR